jgi:CubicO group peptidase (beta-lactamase class C family)
MARSAHRGGAAILSFALGCFPGIWASREASTNPSIAVDGLLEERQTQTAPGAAVLVARDGIVVKEVGYGMAVLERRVPIDADTAFRLGSVSKQFTATAIMLLAEEGRLRYEDPITRFLPELSRFGEGITIRHLLTHTGGLPDYYDVMVEISGVERPRTRHALDVFAAWGKPLFAPGERYEYSNPGYELLALIIERASSQSYAEFMEQRIFSPVGMSSSLVFDERSPRIEKRAYGYRRAGDGFEIDDDDPLNYVIGSGGIYSTAKDLHRWDQALHGGQIVSEETLEAAFRPATVNSGEEFPYGFGWSLEGHLGRRRVSHGGAWVGFQTFIARYVDDQLTVIVLSNLADTDAEGLADSIAGLYLDGSRDAAPRR